MRECDLECSCVASVSIEKVAEGEQTYPSNVKQMLMRRSAPHPETIQTPTGGTVYVVSTQLKFQGMKIRTENGDED